MRTLVVLPTYNEAENIERVLDRIASAMPGVHVLVVDDGSPDGTAELVEKVSGSSGWVDVLRRPGKAGLGSAYREGFAWGLARGYEVLVEMDADLSHDPGALVSLVEPLSRGADLVIGSRYVPGGSVPGWSWYRHLLSRGGNIYAAAWLGLHLTDSTSGFRAYSARILEKLDLGLIRSDGYGFQIEMAYRVMCHGGRVEEVPIRFIDRAEGKSKMSLAIVVEALGLVTWWGIGRALRKVADYARRPSAGSPSKIRER